MNLWQNPCTHPEAVDLANAASAGFIQSCDICFGGGVLFFQTTYIWLYVRIYIYIICIHIQTNTNQVFIFWHLFIAKRCNQEKKHHLTRYNWLLWVIMGKVHLKKCLFVGLPPRGSPHPHEYTYMHFPFAGFAYYTIEGLWFSTPGIIRWMSWKPVWFGHGVSKTDEFCGFFLVLRVIQGPVDWASPHFFCWVVLGFSPIRQVHNSKGWENGNGTSCRGFPLFDPVVSFTNLTEGHL